MRKKYPELATGELLLREVSCDNPMIFTAVRHAGKNVCLVAINLSDHEESAMVTRDKSVGGTAPPKIVLPPFGVVTQRM